MSLRRRHQRHYTNRAHTKKTFGKKKKKRYTIRTRDKGLGNALPEIQQSVETFLDSKERTRLTYVPLHEYEGEGKMDEEYGKKNDQKRKTEGERREREGKKRAREREKK